MSLMIERVAAIIWNYDNSRSYNELDETSKDGCRETARAAIEAMREPTQSMVGAGDAEDGAMFIWVAMIDRALGKTSE